MFKTIGYKSSSTPELSSYYTINGKVTNMVKSESKSESESESESIRLRQEYAINRHTRFLEQKLKKTVTVANIPPNPPSLYHTVGGCYYNA